MWLWYSPPAAPAREASVFSLTSVLLLEYLFVQPIEDRLYLLQVLNG
jgi:hypothetical protein